MSLVFTFGPKPQLKFGPSRTIISISQRQIWSRGPCGLVGDGGIKYKVYSIKDKVKMIKDKVKNIKYKV